MNNALFKTTRFIYDNFVCKNGSVSKDQKQNMKCRFLNKKEQIDDRHADNTAQLQSKYWQ